MMRRLARNVVTMAAVLALGVSLVASPEAAQAKKKTKPTLQKKVTMQVSETKTLKIKKVAKSKIKKTTWKVSNKKSLKVSKKKKNSVKLKALRAGTVKVTAKVKMKNGKNYKLKATISIQKTNKPVETPQTTATVAPTASPQPTAQATIQPTVTPVVTWTPVATDDPAKILAKMDTLVAGSTYEKSIVAPDLMTMLDGTKVTTAEQWEERRVEIKAILQRYMYGMWRDASEEDVTYAIEDNGKIKITITRGDATMNFTASYTCPTGTAPAGGWPVIVSVGGFSNGYVAESGYALISFDPNSIATDGKVGVGPFYTLYPYDATNWKEQTGSIMAWAWGASKVLDALEAGVGADLNISPRDTIVTGVSRYGKAVAAAGAFENRFKVSMPVCSGYGGLTMGRYNSNNVTYNLLPDFENDPKKEDVADLAQWKSTGGNEPINSLQGAGWFNEEYKSFASYQNLPFDAHYIAALSAMENRYLFIVTGINSDMWSSPPGFWWCYNEAKPAFELLGLEDNLAIQMHLNLHGIETEDLCKLFTYTNKHFYNKTTDATSYPAPWNTLLADFTLDDLKTCVFASESNQEAYMAGMPVDPSMLPPNPDNAVPVKVTFGEVETAVVVKRSNTSDALVSPLTGDAEGTGFSFQYGPNMQYGESYARFDLDLPEGKKLSDYSAVTFTIQTDSNYYGKKYALVANPKEIGLPDKIEYDYNSGNISNAINLSGGVELPNSTSSATELTLDIDPDLAAGLDGVATEFSIYIHMESLEGKAQYTISDIIFEE